MTTEDEQIKRLFQQANKMIVQSIRLLEFIAGEIEKLERERLKDKRNANR